MLHSVHDTPIIHNKEKKTETYTVPTPCILLKFDRLKSATITVNNNNTELYLVTYVAGFTLLESAGRPESASLFSSPRVEATCRSFNVFFSDEGMI